MTLFIILGAAMILAALAFLLRPLLRTSTARRWPTALVALALIPLSGGLYGILGNWNWQQTDHPQTPAGIDSMLAKLETRLQADPNNVEGWLLLGRSYFQLNRYYKSADAYQQAYTLTKGDNVEALLGLGEALALSDETTLTGRAATVFEQALTLAPNHPKALWYGGLIAYQSNRPAEARDRWMRLTGLNPPDDVKQILATKIAELDRRLQTAAGPAMAAGLAAPGPQPKPGPEPTPASVKVRISLAPELTNKVSPQATLFVLARTGQGGPPLAVKKLSNAGFPLTVELTDRDAMIAGHTLSSVPEVTVIARISRSGAPQAQSGDLEGKLAYKPGSTERELIINALIP